jgi:hypothetical protein
MPIRTGAADVLAAPRHALGLAMLACLVCTMALAYPALAGGFLVNPFSDQYIGGYPVREFGAQVLRQTGSFPLWNPYIFAGLPYVAAMHGDIFYPTFLLRVMLPTDVAMTWSFIIHLWLAGVFTYCFLRAYGYGFYGALLGGIAYMMSGQIASLVSPGHDGKLYVNALFPLALWMLVRGVRDGRLWSWGVLAITVGLAVLSPHPQLLQYMLLACGAFALLLAFADLGAGRMERSVALRRLGLALGAVLLGGAMGAIQYLPVREYVAWSPRAGGFRAYEVATSYSMPIEELINTYVPEFTGILDRYWGANGIHFHSEYLGAAALVLAGAAFGARGPGRQFVRFWTGTLVVALLWALGGNTPFYHLVYALVPGTKFFRAPSTIFFIVSFAVGVLACVGTERLLARETRPRYLVAWMGFAALMAVLGVAGGLTNLAASIAGPERFDAVAANAGSLSLGAVRALLFVSCAAGVGLAYLRGKLSHRAAAVALAAVVAADLWTVDKQYWRFSPPAAELYASDPTIEYIKAQRQPGRVVAIATAGAAYHDPMLNGDGLMVHGVRQVLGYHGNELGRYQRLYGKNEDLVSRLANPNFWQLTNLKYFLTNLPQPPFEGAERLVGPVRNAPGSTVYLYGMPGENPAAWVAPAIVKAPDEAVLATLLDPRFPVHSTALFDTSASVTSRTDLKRPPEPLAIRPTFTRYEPGRISLTLDGPAPAGSALVVSENFYPGWRATVNGRPAAVERADFSLMGVALPAGATSIDLVFASAPFETGKAVTLATATAALLLALVGAIADRRRRA